MPPAFSGYPAADRTGWADVPGRVRPHPRRDVGRVQRVRDRSRGRRRCPTSSSSTSRPGSTSTLYPAEADYPRRDPLDADLASPGLRVRATDGPFELPAELAGATRARLLYLSLGASAPPTSTLMQRLIDVLGRTPHRFIVSMGPQHDQLALRAEHAGRGVPAPAGDPAAGRPGHHPRRQQHDHRVLPLRQADDRAAALLGPVRQRPAGGRDRASASAWRPTSSPTTELLGTIERLLADGDLAARLAAIVRAPGVGAGHRAGRRPRGAARPHREPVLRGHVAGYRLTVPRGPAVRAPGPSAGPPAAGRRACRAVGASRRSPAQSSEQAGNAGRPAAAPRRFLP